jgi:hypothetical protein
LDEFGRAGHNPFRTIPLRARARSEPPSPPRSRAEEDAPEPTPPGPAETRGGGLRERHRHRGGRAGGDGEARELCGLLGPVLVEGRADLGPGERSASSTEPPLPVQPVASVMRHCMIARDEYALLRRLLHSKNSGALTRNPWLRMR